MSDNRFSKCKDCFHQACYSCQNTDEFVPISDIVNVVMKKDQVISKKYL